MLKKLFVLSLVVGLCLAFGLGKANAFMRTADGQPFDLGFFPLFDVRDTAERTDNWQNYITIQNTSNKWTAAHLRFRTWRKSIEVYDHIILLSPYDVFYVVIERLPSGDVQLRSGDTQTCLNSGLIFPGDTVWTTNFQTYLLEQCGYTAAAGYDLYAEMQAGYIELIGLWQLSRNFPVVATNEDSHNLATIVADVYNDGHAGNINVFDAMEALFWNFAVTPGVGVYAGLPHDPDWPFIGPAAHQNPATNITVIDGPELAVGGVIRYGVDCQNDLLATMAMGDGTTGQYEMANFFGIMDFRTENWAAGAPIAGNIHRDTHDFGAILFSPDAMSWLPYDRGATAVGSGVGIAPYINENWATTVGPGIRDGDDLNVDRVGVAVAGMANLGLGVVAGFNDHWSLDDVERLLLKTNIWYNYFNNAFGAAYQTDFNLTFPTKHYHWYFRDWMFWNESAWLGLAGAPPPPPFVLEYAAYPWVPIAPYGTVDLYWAAVQGYRSNNARHIAGRSIEADFDLTYSNGPVDGGATIWDISENTVAGGEPPPGSPWVPVAPQRIPHEANIISVGAATGSGTGIEEANGILDTAFDMGQFTVGAMTLLNGDRVTAGHPLWPAAPYAICQIGVMIFDLNYAGVDYRSTMAPWNYIFTYWP